MITTDMISSIKALRPFVPAKDFAISQSFYETLGFTLRRLGPELTEMSLGGHSFLLQNFYVAEYAGNFMMTLLVDRIDPWWQHVEGLNLASTFGVRLPQPPKKEPWGLWVSYIVDPSGVLWHIAAPE